MLREYDDSDFAIHLKFNEDDKVEMLMELYRSFMGPGMLADGLAETSVPVGILTAADDDLITPAYHAEHYAKHIPDATLTLIPKGGHFVFVTTCTFMPTIVDFFITEIALCGREIDIDRSTVQPDIANIVVDFFSLHLAEAT